MEVLSMSYFVQLRKEGSGSQEFYVAAVISVDVNKCCNRVKILASTTNISARKANT